MEDQYRDLKLELNGVKMDFQVVQRSTQDDSQTIWDNINELQEIMNITTNNIEDIYDKDILRLQNLQNSVNSDVRRLRQDVDSALEDIELGRTSGASGLTANMENTVLELREEMKQLKQKTGSANGLSDSFRNELNSITIGIDELNREKQANAQEIEQLKRYISQLEVEKVKVGLTTYFSCAG